MVHDKSNISSKNKHDVRVDVKLETSKLFSIKREVVSQWDYTRWWCQGSNGNIMSLYYTLLIRSLNQIIHRETTATWVPSLNKLTQHVYVCCCIKISMLALAWSTHLFIQNTWKHLNTKHLHYIKYITCFSGIYLLFVHQSSIFCLSCN